MLDLPVCRLRQIVANVEARVRAEMRYKAAITEWQTKTICSVVAQTVPGQKGKPHPLMEMVKDIRLDIDARMDGTDEAQGSTSKGQEIPPDVYVEQGSQVANNPAGSFERLARGFGAARR